MARWNYADRYENESFWRIPGGRPAAALVSSIGSIGTYYAFTLPFSESIPKSDWMLWVGTISVVTLLAGLVIYVLGRRSQKN